MGLLALWGGLVGASLCVQTGIGDTETLDGSVVEEVFGDDLVDVFEVNAAVPDGFGIDDDDGAVLALVETGGLVGADGVLEASFFDGFLEGRLELFAVLAATAGAGGVFVAVVVADEEMMFELWHEAIPF